jgi:hypothetical protein
VRSDPTSKIPTLSGSKRLHLHLSESGNDFNTRRVSTGGRLQTRKRHANDVHYLRPEVRDRLGGHGLAFFVVDVFEEDDTR